MKGQKLMGMGSGGRKGELARFVRFGAVGGVGTAVNMVVLYVMTLLGAHYLFGSVVATECVIVSNFFGNSFVTFRDQGSRLSLRRRFVRFQTISMVTVAGTVALLAAFVSVLGERFLLVANGGAILMMFVVNYVLNRRLTWASAQADDGAGKGAYPGLAPEYPDQAPEIAYPDMEYHASKVSSKTMRGSARRMDGFDGLKGVKVFLIFSVCFAVVMGAAYADIAAVSKFGFHPLSHKQVILYTQESEGSFEVIGGNGESG